ncbi:MAG: hypothetical protein V1682_03680, partial [Candidatus Omnitrophota bacterium]
MEPKMKKIVLGLVLLGVLCTFLTPSALAVQIKRVQSGTIYFDSNDTVNTEDLSYDVDQSKSIILIYARVRANTANRDQNYLFTSWFEDNGAILVERAGGTDSARVDWYVLEFEDGVRVVRGVSTMKDTVVTKDIDIPPPAIDTTKTFTILQRRAAYANQTYSEGLLGTASIVDGDTMQINRGCRSVVTAVSFVYQIVEFQTDAKVQTGEATIAYNSASATVNTTDAIADFGKTFLVTQVRGNSNVLDGIEGWYMTMGNIDETDGAKKQLYFRRGNLCKETSNTVTVRYYVVELTDGSSFTQKNPCATPLALPSASTTTVPQTATSSNFGTSVNLARSFPIISSSGGNARTTGAGSHDDFYDENAIGTTITASNISVSRFSSSTTTEPETVTAYTPTLSNVDWFVTELCPITVKTPNGGETLVVNDTYDITWRNSADVTNVGIEYSDDNGSTWSTIIASTAASAKSYTWTVGYDDSEAAILPTDEKDTDCFVRVFNAAASTQRDASNAVFTIKSKLQVVIPNGGQTWLVGGAEDITWNKWGNFGGTVKLRYSIDTNHATWSDISGATTLAVTPGTFNWSPIPLGASGVTTQVRVVSNSNSDVYDDSDANLEIRGNITVTTPDENSIWPTGYEETIYWTLNSTSTLVDIYYSTDSGTIYTLLSTAGGVNAQNIDSTHGSYPWTPPIDKASQYAQIKVVDHSNTNVLGESEIFEIAGSITVTQPNNGESWFVSTTTNKIKWTVSPSASIDEVDLYYCVDFTTSKTWIKINVTAVPSSQGTTGYDWEIPNNITVQTTAGIKVQNAAVGYEGIYDEVDTPFKIKGWLQIIEPDTGDVIPYDQNFSVQWTPKGNLHDKYGDNFMMQYSNDGGTGWSTIYTALNGSSGSQTWAAANIPADNLGEADSRVRVALSGDTTIGGESGNFSIVDLALTSPSATLTTPVLTWQCGTAAHITWSISGTPAWKVLLYYSKDGSAPYENPIEASGNLAASQRFYDWTIPADATVFKAGDDGKNTDIVVKIVAALYSNVASISTQPVTINSRFINLVPNGGVITVGSLFNIDWVTQGDVANVKVTYSTDGGGTFGGTISSGTSNVDGLEWNPVNCPVDNDIKVRVESSVHSDIKTDSAQNIDAKGKIEITSPSATNRLASSLTAEGIHRITWIVNGGLSNIGLMDLYFAEDGSNYGTAFHQVDTATDSYYDWTVPDSANIPTATNKIKAVDNGDSQVSDESEAFDIRGRLWNGTLNHAMVEPNGGEPYYVGDPDIDIQWKHMGNIGDCMLYYDTNEGESYPNYITTVAYNKDKDGGGICHHSWAIPTTTGKKYRVKIYAIDDQTYTYANSQANFMIHGKITLNSPGKGTSETWYVDGTNNISWGVTGDIANVDILFDKDEGNNLFEDLTIVSGYTGASPYPWAIPSGQEATRQLVTSDKCRVQVRDHNDTVVSAESTQNFYMKPRVFLGSEITPATSWEVTGNSDLFTWTTTGALSNLKLYSSNNEGQAGSWHYQTTFAASAGSYQWTNIPTTDTVAHGKAVIKLVREETGVEDTAVSDESQWFTIKGKINVTSPLTGQNYNVGESYKIIWNVQGVVGNLDMRYNTNAAGGYPDGDWVVVDEAINIPSDYCTGEPTGYSFTAPNDTTPNMKLRLYETSHTAVFGPPMAGSPVHKVLGNILFDKPTGSPNTEDQTLTVGTQYPVSWSLVGAFTTLRAYYKKIGDAQWTQIGGDLAGSTETINFTPPDSAITNAGLTDKLLFKVEDALDSNNVYRETRTDHANTVIGSLTALLPASSPQLTVGESVPVKWKKYGNIGDIKFELWDGSNYLDNGDGSGLPDTYDSGASGETGVYLDPNWIVPDFIGTGRKIRITSKTYSGITDETGLLTIKGAMNSIVSPTLWYVGENHDITWEATGSMSAVKIQLYVDGVTYTIENSYNNGGLGLDSGVNTYVWSASDTLQQQRSENCKVIVSSVQNTDVLIETDPFTIRPKITVTTPGSAWIAASESNTIAWSAIAAPTTSVDIWLHDTAAGFADVQLGDNIAKGLLSYNSTVTIPSTLAASAKIIMKDHEYPAFITGESSPFKVIGNFQITAPTTASKWKVADATKAITWIPKGDMGTANIYVDYDYSAPGNYTLLFSGVNSAAGTKDWTPSIPDEVSNDVRIKITDADKESDTAVESDTFSVISGFEFTAPLGGETHHIDSDTNPTGYIIKWKTFGLAVTAVKLEYWNKDLNGGLGDWATIKSDVTNENHGETENT